MERQVSWLGAFREQPTQPARVPTDTVLPVHFWDNVTSSRSIVIHLQFLFDDELDPKRLAAALERLFRKDGWRKLGGRLRLSENGNLELHVPNEYDERRPAFLYHHESHGTDIGEHPLASRLPEVSATPQVVGNIGDFVSLMRQTDDPKCLHDYLYSDKPMLGLHIVSFTDATLVTLNWSHVLFDAMGCKTFLDAWSLVLQGREDEVLPFHGATIDPLEPLGANSTVPYFHANRQLSLWQLIVFVLRYIADKVFWRPVDETRIICVPAATVQSLRKSALKDIQDVQKITEDATGDLNSFLSEGDVISAWATRLIVSAALTSMKQTIVINIVFGLRWLLSEDLLPTTTAYVGNAATTVSAFLSAKSVLNLPLGLVATAIRKAITVLSTREQVEARLAIERASIEKTGNPALLGDSWMHAIFCTNWTKAHFHDVNFLSAVIKSGKHRVSQKPGHPAYVHAYVQTKGFPLISNLSLIGKDAAGNYWLEMILRKSYWLEVDRALKAAAASNET